ncbi:hypothetical protein L7F22_066159 [Adiantum nelumboides]|nr:hypothetical protein [Adiantum nelumboides]
MRMANLAGENPSTFIQRQQNFYQVRSYINKCKSTLDTHTERGTKLATGLIKEILSKLQLDFNEDNSPLLDIDANELLKTKTQGIFSYTIEMLHFGCNVDLDKLYKVDRKTADKILNQIKHELGYTDNEPLLTDDKFTWHFDRDLYNTRFGEDKDPFAKKENATSNKLNN